MLVYHLAEFYGKKFNGTLTLRSIPIIACAKEEEIEFILQRPINNNNNSPQYLQIPATLSLISLQ